MKFTRQSVAAALLVAGFSASFANTASAASVSASVSAFGEAEARRPDAAGRGPGEGPQAGPDGGRFGGPDGQGPGAGVQDGRGPGGSPERGPDDGPDGGPDNRMEGGRFGGPGPGFGGHGPGAPGPEMPFGSMPHLRRLKLSEAQQDKLFAIMHAAAPKHRDNEKAQRKAHEALRELDGADRVDDARASAAARDLGQAVATGVLLQARTRAQVLAILTPEQRAQLRGQRPPGPPERE